MRENCKAGNLYFQAVQGKDEIIKLISSYKFMVAKSGDLKHCAACIANDFFKLSSKQWNNTKGAEYYSAVLSVIVHFDLY